MVTEASPLFKSKTGKEMHALHKGLLYVNVVSQHLIVIGMTEYFLCVSLKLTTLNTIESLLWALIKKRHLVARMERC